MMTRISNRFIQIHLYNDGVEQDEGTVRSKVWF
jgi:hypothetical protein